MEFRLRPALPDPRDALHLKTPLTSAIHWLSTIRLSEREGERKVDVGAAVSFSEFSFPEGESRARGRREIWRERETDRRPKCGKKSAFPLIRGDHGTSLIFAFPLDSPLFPTKNGRDERQNQFRAARGYSARQTEYSLCQRGCRACRNHGSFSRHVAATERGRRNDERVEGDDRSGD